jgi:hypothetical protein
VPLSWTDADEMNAMTRTSACGGVTGFRMRRERARILNPAAARLVEELWRSGCDSSGKTGSDR